MTPSTVPKDIQFRFSTALVLSALILVGFWLRIRNLGDLALIGDEGIQILAVKGILKYGLPKFESGYIYTRSLPFLYIQAAAANLFDLNPFWLRLPSLLFSLAVIIPTYFMGKVLFNRRVGLLAALIITFSVWEIELARYARFYTIFQFGFLVSLFCFYRGFILDENNYKTLFLLVGIFTLSCHALGQVLFTLFAIPLFSNSFSFRRKVIFSLWGVGLVGVYKVYAKLVGVLKASGSFNFIHDVTGEQGGGSIFGFLEKIRIIIGLPRLAPPDFTFLMEALKQNHYQVTGLAIITGAATIYFIYRCFRGDTFFQSLLAVSIVWFAFFYKFGLVITVFALYTILYLRNVRAFRDPMLNVVYGTVAICFVFWMTMIVGTPEVTLKQAIGELIFYPNVYIYFLKWFIGGWPLMFVFFVIGCSALLAQYLRNSEDIRAWFILGAIFIPVFLSSFFIFYPESRYWFHLYPLIVIVFSMVSISAGSHILANVHLRGKWRRSVAALTMIVGVVFVSQDANPLQAWHVGNRTYQSLKDPFRSYISWEFYAKFHQDHKSPSIFVKENLSPEDRIIVLGPIHMIGLYHFYAGKVDYAVAPSRTPHYYAGFNGEKIVNYVTASEVLAGLRGYKTFIENCPNGIWLLGDHLLLLDENNFYSRPLKEYFRSLVQNPDFTGLDGQTFAVKVR